MQLYNSFSEFRIMIFFCCLSRISRCRRHECHWMPCLDAIPLLFYLLFLFHSVFNGWNVFTVLTYYPLYALHLWRINAKLVPRGEYEVVDIPSFKMKKENEKNERKNRLWQPLPDDISYTAYQCVTYVYLQSIKFKIKFLYLF